MNAKVMYSLQAALLFFVISSPFMYNIVEKVFGKLFTVSINGCPTTHGLLLHTLVYGLVVYLLMML